MPIQLLMPALSPTMEEGKLVKWLVREGDKIQAGDIIAEIETDKAVMEYESVDDGIIGRLLFPDGAEGIKINTPIALILQDGEAATAMDGFLPQHLLRLRRLRRRQKRQQWQSL